MLGFDYLSLLLQTEKTNRTRTDYVSWMRKIGSFECAQIEKGRKIYIQQGTCFPYTFDLYRGRATRRGGEIRQRRKALEARNE